MRRRHFLALLAALAGLAGTVTSTLSAAQPRELRDLSYVKGGSSMQRLDLYLPGDDAPRHPLIVWIHGGGWLGGSKSGCPAKPMVAAGYAVASVEYRFSRDAVFPAQIEDCKAAIRWLRAHAAEYQIDPERIGVWGASAGGHLVALLGTTGNIKTFDKGENLDCSSSVNCVIDWFGPTDFLHFGDPPAPDFMSSPNNLVAKLLGGPVNQKQELARSASPFYFVSKESAPFLIMQGEADPLVPMQQSQALHAALEKAGVPSTLRLLPGAGHGGPAFNAGEITRQMTDFMEKYLRGSH